jgi:transposase
MLIQTVGIDLGKTVFHVVGLHASGTVALKRRFSRSQLLAFMANLPACLIGMEACCGAHHLGRDLAGQGHTVRLIPAQFVRPFVKSNKNDFIDAEAIAEAVQRPTMRFVQIKTGFATGWCRGARASSIRFVPSCWNAESSDAKAGSS